jgi:hypothetical protein
MDELRAAKALRSGEPVIGGPLEKSAFDLGGVCVASMVRWVRTCQMTTRILRAMMVMAF